MRKGCGNTLCECMILRKTKGLQTFQTVCSVFNLEKKLDSNMTPNTSI